MIHDKYLRVGACGWDHSHWQDSFYPGDLPEDWRLGYYANAFSTVLVPEHQWRSADIAQWGDEVPDEFHFYFQGASTSSDAADIKLKLGDKFAGFSGPEVALLEYQSRSLREWKQWLLHINLDAVFLMDENLTVNQLNDFKLLLELMGK